ncbi:MULTISPECIES: response regulator transcription factor [unclassified Paludibacterium]|uniref:response regulator n=1 Tax=unclassified Paludibacterium TaxID=2618429 RepID=UPI001C05D7DE|nr:response regulator transcription factor [Paludibacterium sp. B53371]BEV71739.1 response regulator transcription factor [Paludibacterium sp. THUN1379]
MRVLLIEDDPMIGEEVQAALREAAYAVDWVRDGVTASNYIGSDLYDVALLDLGLPGCDGMTVLRQLRSRANPLPVLILSARDQLQDRLHGLDEGADDYLVKPFAMAELLARMRVVIRRRGGQGDSVLSNGLLSLNVLSKEAQVAQGEPVRLTQREFSLLHTLLQRPGAIFSRAELEDKIYGWGEEVESNAVAFLIHALRKKLGHEAIKNVRGLGWMVSKRD